MLIIRMWLSVAFKYDKKNKPRIIYNVGWLYKIGWIILKTTLFDMRIPQQINIALWMLNKLSIEWKSHFLFNILKKFAFWF